MKKWKRWTFSIPRIGGKVEFENDDNITAALFDGQCAYIELLGKDKIAEIYGTTWENVINDLMQYDYTITCETVLKDNGAGTCLAYKVPTRAFWIEFPNIYKTAPASR